VLSLSFVATDPPVPRKQISTISSWVRTRVFHKENHNSNQAIKADSSSALKSLAQLRHGSDEQKIG